MLFKLRMRENRKTVWSGYNWGLSNMVIMLVIIKREYKNNVM